MGYPETQLTPFQVSHFPQRSVKCFSNHAFPEYTFQPDISPLPEETGSAAPADIDQPKPEDEEGNLHKAPAHPECLWKNVERKALNFCVC